MLVIAYHKIHDIDIFWSETKAVGENPPAGFKLHQIHPCQNMQSGTSLWEVPSMHAFSKFLDDRVGGISKNYFYKVTSKAAIGLPTELNKVIN